MRFFLLVGTVAYQGYAEPHMGKLTILAQVLLLLMNPQFYWIRALFICMYPPKVLSPNTMSFVGNIETVS